MKLPDFQKVLEAMADPTRLRILSLLQEGELCVCDVMSVLKEPQSKISRHLAYLRRFGMVKTRKQGFWMYYSLTAPKLKTIQAVLRALDYARQDFDELKKDLTEYKKLKKNLIACRQ